MGRNAPPPCVAATSFTHMPALPQELVCSPCLPGSPFSTHRNTQVLPSPPHRTAFLHIPIHASTEHSACSFSSVLFLPSQVLGLLHSCLPAFAWPQLSGVPWENGSEVTDVTVQGQYHCRARQSKLGALHHQVLAPGHLGIPRLHCTADRTSCHHKESRTLWLRL